MKDQQFFSKINASNGFKNRGSNIVLFSILKFSNLTSIYKIVLCPISYLLIFEGGFHSPHYQKLLSNQPARIYNMPCFSAKLHNYLKYFSNGWDYIEWYGVVNVFFFVNRYSFYSLHFWQKVYDIEVPHLYWHLNNNTGLRNEFIKLSNNNKVRQDT